MDRERFGSRLGFILLSAGCAIGIGNVWKFPYLVGQNGGGIFVLLYLLFLIIMGVPVMTMEFAMGRAAQSSPVKLYYKLEKKGQKWHWHGYVCLAGNILLMMYYTVVAGWMIKYCVDMAAGRFTGVSQNEVMGIFTENLASPVIQAGYMFLVIVLAVIICAKGLQNGLEKITKWLMSILLVLMIILAVHSIFSEGAAEGLSFYLLPNIENVRNVGLINVISAALTQAFFTLSIGIGAMAIFGSYIDKDRSLLGESVQISLLDTFVAVTAGLIIFPACFAYNVQPDSGPSLIFITLPNIFKQMSMGRLWGSLFFIFMSFASLSTVLAVFENIMAMLMDLTGKSRKQTAFITLIMMTVLSLPCALGYNILSFIHPLGAGSTILDGEDFLVSNLILPIGALVYILFCTGKSGWGWEAFKEEANTGKGLKIRDWMKPYMTYILPVMAAVVIIIGLI